MRKWNLICIRVLMFVACMLVFSACMNVEASSNIMYGDVDHDGDIDEDDERKALKAQLGLITLTEEEKQICDVNGDGVFDSKDTDLIIYYVQGEISEFPVESMLDYIKVITPPNKVEYYYGDKISYSGMVVRAYYKDGRSQNVTSYSASLDSEEVGNHDVMISYTEHTVIQTSLQQIEQDVTRTTDQRIVIKEILLSSINIASFANKEQYIEGETFEPTGMTVYANYNNDTKKNVTNSVEYNPTIMSTGITSIKLIYKENGISCYTYHPVTVYKKCYYGHTWNSGVVTKEATSTETGVKIYTCSVCNETKTETIPINPNRIEKKYDGKGTVIIDDAVVTYKDNSGNSYNVTNNLNIAADAALDENGTVWIITLAGAVYWYSTLESEPVRHRLYNEDSSNSEVVAKQFVYSSNTDSDIVTGYVDYDSNSEKNLLTANQIKKNLGLPTDPEIITDGDWQYCENEDGTITIVKYTGSDEEITIPDKINGKNVSVIGEYAFAQLGDLVDYDYDLDDWVVSYGAQERADIKKIVIPATVTSILEGAFAGCVELERIIINNDIVQLGEKILGDNLPKKIIICGGLSTKQYAENNDILYVYVEENEISGKCGDNVFFNLNLVTQKMRIYGSGEMRNFYLTDSPDQPWFDWRGDIKELIVEEGVSKITPWVFERLKIKKIKILDNVIIDEYAFHLNKELTQLEIGENCTLCGNAFSECSQLKNVSLGEGCISSKGSDGYAYGRMFRDCKELETISLPNSWRFYDSTENNYYVGQFDGCSKLKDIRLKEDNTEYKVEDHVIYSIDGKKLIYYPQGLKEEIYTVIDGTVEISGQAFRMHPYVKYVEISDSVNKINAYAFYEASNLESIVIPDSVSEVDVGSFYNNIKKVAVSENITEISKGHEVVGIYPVFGKNIETIYGKAGSYAETYATENGISFKERIEVSFNATGGTVSKDYKVVLPDEPYFTLPTPTRENYNFDGWYTEEQGGDKVEYSTIVTPTESHTLYAHWSVDDAIKQSASNDLEEYINIEDYSNQNQELIQSIIDKAQDDIANATVTDEINNIIQKAKSSIDKIKTRAEECINVTFDAMGGTSSINQIQVVPGEAYSTLPTAVRENYQFDGWYTLREGGEKVESTTIVTETTNHTLYARWRENEVIKQPAIEEIEGYINIEDYSVQNQERIQSIINKAKNDIENAATAEEISNILQKAKADIDNIEAEPKNYIEVTFDAMGGTVSQEHMQVIPGEAYSTLPTAVRDNYIFDGWYTLEEGGEKVESITVVTQTTNHTLYAHWSEKKEIYENDSIVVPEKDKLQPLPKDIDNESNLGGNEGISGDSNNSDKQQNNQADINNSAKLQDNQSDSIIKDIPSLDVKNIVKEYSKKKFSLSVKTDSDGEISFSGDNKKVAEISKTGKVILKKCGKVKITVSVKESKQYKAVTKSFTLSVVPKQVLVTRVQSPSKGAIRFKWKKISDIDGYQVYVSSTKNFKAGTAGKRFGKKEKLMYTTGFSSGKKYYLKIRTFKKVGKETYYSPWSKAKSVKVK